MKKSLLLIIVGLLLFSSCGSNTVDLGDVTYYPSFLWSKAKTKPLEKTLTFDFSRDAQLEKGVYAVFEFVDNTGKRIEADKMEVWIDGQKLTDNTFRVGSQDTSKEIRISFSPEVESGKYQGFLHLKEHRLHRLGNTVLTEGQQADAFQWTIYYDKSMNPLAKVLLWTFIVLLVCLLVWFLIVRPVVYPHFGTFRKSVTLSERGKIVYTKNVVFKGTRRVVFSDKVIKQSFWNRLFTGEVRTVVHPLFKQPLTFIPKKKKAMAYGPGYSIMSNPIPKAGVTEITHIAQNLKLILR